MTGLFSSLPGNYGKAAELRAKWVGYARRRGSFFEGHFKIYALKTDIYRQYR